MAGKMVLMWRAISYGHWWIISNGHQVTQFDLDLIMWISKINCWKDTLNTLLYGSKVFLKRRFRSLIQRFLIIKLEEFLSLMILFASLNRTMNNQIHEIIFMCGSMYSCNATYLFLLIIMFIWFSCIYITVIVEFL